MSAPLWRTAPVDRRESVTSTNAVIKALSAERELAEGYALVAYHQTQGRGRLGRSFSSPEGGLYLSALLRPQAPPDRLLHLTAMAAVAVRRAVFACCGLRPDIKWTNDLVVRGKKLGGILTELLTDADGTAVLIGIGLNCNTLPHEVAQMATSLRAETGAAVSVDALAQALRQQLQALDRALLTHPAPWMEEFSAACITLGQTVQVIRGENRRAARALSIDENGGLRVRYETGEEATITTGEVSIRGMYGYV